MISFFFYLPWKFRIQEAERSRTVKTIQYVGWMIMKTGLDVRNVDSSFMLVA